MKNRDNNVTRSCNSEKGVYVPVQHGIGISVCVIRQKYEHVIKAHLQLSYSDKM